MQGDRDQRDEAVRINTLMDNLNNLKSKLNNFTVMDELGQPIGEIQDLILDDTHQLNLVIAILGSAENKPSVLLNGRRIKKVSVQTHAVFVDIVKADVDFLPEYTPLESSDSRRDSFTNRAESNPAPPPLSYSAAAAAAAALMGGSAIAPPAPEDDLSLEDDLFTSDRLLPEPAADFAALEDDLFRSDPPAPEDNLSLEDDLFTSDPLLPEPAADFAALEDDLFTSDPLLPEPAADFAASVKMSSMESESLDDDWFADDDEDDLATSAGLPELSELELSPSEDFLLASESTAEIATNNSLDDWSDLVSPTGQPSLDYSLPSEAVPLPELANDDLLENPFALAEADEISELGFVEVGSASWGQAAQPIDTLSSGLLDPLTDAEIESELEDLPDIGFLLDDSSVDTVNEDAEEFLLPSDFGEAGSTTDLTLESLPDRDPLSEPSDPLSEPSLDDFGFPDIATAEISLDDFGFPDTTTVGDDLASQVPNFDLNLSESLVDADSDLSWTNEIETDELFELNLDNSFNQPQMETASELELELADLDLSATESTDLEFETDSGLDLETDSDLEFEIEYSDLDLEAGLNLETGLDLETEAIAPLPLDFSLDDDFSNVVEPSAAIMDLSESEIPTSFIEVPMAAIAPMDSDSLANLELDTAFDVDLSLEDEFGTAGFAIADTNDLSEFTLQNDRFEPEPETITSLTDLEFTGLPTDNLPTDDLPTDDLTEMFGSVADFSFAEEGEFEDLSDLRSESVRDMALDSLFDNPVDNLESASDEFNFSTPSMGFVDPAAGMAAAPGILAGLAGLAAGRSPDLPSLPIEETPALDIADISDLSDVSAQADSSLNDPAFSMSDVFESDVSESDVSEAIAPSSTLSIPSNSEPIVASLDDMVPLLEERLQVEYERRKVGEVIIRKKIETRMIQVPVRYEVLVIEQVSPEQKTLAEVDLSQGTFSDEVPAVAGKPTVSGEFKSAKTASAVIDAIAKTLRHQCKSIRIEIELDDSSLTQSYQDWLDRCSDL